MHTPAILGVPAPIDSHPAPVTASWITRDTNGQDHAVLYLAAPANAPDLAFTIASERLGLLFGDTRTMPCYDGVRVAFIGLQARILVPGGRYEFAVDDEWRTVAERRGQALVALAWRPLDHDASRYSADAVEAHYRACATAGDVTVGWCPVG